MSIIFQRPGYAVERRTSVLMPSPTSLATRVASSVSSMFACKQRKKRYKTYGRRREKADFAACEQQISQTSLRVHAD